MNNFTKINLIYNLHFIPSFRRYAFLDDFFNQKDFDIQDKSYLIESIITEFNHSIGVLNTKQFENLIQLTSKEFNLITLNRKLDIYNIKKEYIKPILEFCRKYHEGLANKACKNIFEITSDNYATIIKQGWIGDLEVNPVDEKLTTLRLPAFTSKGNKKRFFLANLLKITPIRYDDCIRYRIYFSNPRIVIT